mmetsp:Transcript_21110/g.46527  ORF Transcript_21110/g.46527 Transcript_21110/m.46527 type:complete len:272 (-) Transcript_21110:50-865(-)
MVAARTELSPEENAELRAAFEDAVAQHSARDKEELLQILCDRLTDEASAALKGICQEPAVLGAAELARLCGHLDFVAARGIQCLDPLPLEVRVEGTKAYVLAPPSCCLVGEVGGTSLLWVHDEAWAAQRFVTGGADFGLCGQRLGLSKFVTCTKSPPCTKGAALDLLGLRGYAAFDKPGKLHLVCAEGETIQALAQPMVPLLYMWAESGDASEATRWVPASHFQEGTVPGYTSGLVAELVMRTFQVPAATSEELASKGVRCIVLDDSTIAE